MFTCLCGVSRRRGMRVEVGEQLGRGSFSLDHIYGPDRRSSGLAANAFTDRAISLAQQSWFKTPLNSGRLSPLFNQDIYKVSS